jgi:hypothetical protein
VEHFVPDVGVLVIVLAHVLFYVRHDLTSPVNSYIRPGSGRAQLAATAKWLAGQSVITFGKMEMSLAETFFCS